MNASLAEQIKAYLSSSERAFALNNLKHSWENLSSSYRSQKGAYTHESSECLAYILGRMPGTYAACRSVFREVLQRGVSFPKTMLDLGAGPGTAGWALSSLSEGRKVELTQLEKDPGFIDFCKKITPPHAQVINVEGWEGLSASAYDWVLISYALSELSEKEKSQWIERAWKACTQALILLEPGTPEGYKNLLAIRTWLLDQGAFILAPCPHQGICPLKGEDWCHFSVRLERSVQLRQLKGASLAYEDEKYAYLVFVKGANFLGGEGRILRHPQVRKGHVYLDVCKESGSYERVLISARDKKFYKQARALQWGQAVSLPKKKDRENE